MPAIDDLARQTIARQHADIERLRRVLQRAIPVLDMMAKTDDDPKYKSLLGAAKSALTDTAQG